MSKLPTNNNDAKPQVTKEQLEQFLKQMGQPNKQLSPAQLRAQKLLQFIMPKIQNLLARLDRFIDFVTKKHGEDRNEVLQNARSPIVFGVYVIIIFVFFGGLWASFAPLNSAAVASGTVISSSNKKIIQSNEGGIIKAIYVKQGDEVKAGQALIEFDATRAKAEYEGILSQYRSLLATESRLLAERDNLDNIVFPEFLIKDRHIDNVDKLLDTQENLLKSKRERIKAQKDLLQQKLIQLHSQIEGFEARKVAGLKSLEIIQERVKSLRTLHGKGFAQKMQLSEKEGNEADIKAQLAVFDTEIAKIKQDIIANEIERMHIDSDNMLKTFDELRDIEPKLATIAQQFTQAKEVLERVVLKSPVDGTVNAMFFHTIGGVVQGGAHILEISPANDYLVIEAKVPQKNIDAVRVGLVAKIKFSAFKSRTTPSFTGKVVALSPDIVKRDEMGQPMQGIQGANPMQHDSAYIARIEIDMEEFNKVAKLRKLKLQPGMNAEVQIITGTRTLLRYLLDPLTDTMFTAFREK